ALGGDVAIQKAAAARRFAAKRFQYPTGIQGARNPITGVTTSSSQPTTDRICDSRSRQPQKAPATTGNATVKARASSRSSKTLCRGTGSARGNVHQLELDP